MAQITVDVRHLQAFAEVGYQVAGGGGAHGAMAALRRVVPLDAYEFVAYDPATGRHQSVISDGHPRIDHDAAEEYAALDAYRRALDTRAPVEMPEPGTERYFRRHLAPLRLAGRADRAALPRRGPLHRAAPPDRQAGVPAAHRRAGGRRQPAARPRHRPQPVRDRPRGAARRVPRGGLRPARHAARGAGPRGVARPVGRPRDGRLRAGLHRLARAEQARAVARRRRALARSAAGQGRGRVPGGALQGGRWRPSGRAPCRTT
ncbi:hypothetical protein [Nonomuraea salmonea]|uniref:hypothetical protein n=1 Tax=Nonomuraea salmonea TaxID=46181 RepID=UPI0031F01C26